jgi:hypothetical protein
MRNNMLSSVTLNMFQGPRRAIAASVSPERRAVPWMLKHVQHDDMQKKAQ